MCIDQSIHFLLPSESCEPIEDMSKLMEAITVPGCLRTLVDPYPLEEPLRPDVADVDRVAIQQSSICERPSLPTPPPPKGLSNYILF